MKTFAAGESFLAVDAAIPRDIYCGGSSGNSMMVYLSHPTEYGTLYSRAELQAFRKVCDEYGNMKIGEPAIRAAAAIRKALQEKGYRLYFESPTNQTFVVIENDALKMLGEKVEYGFWEKYDDDHTVIRFATDWGTTEAETNALIDIL